MTTKHEIPSLGWKMVGEGTSSEEEGSLVIGGGHYQSHGTAGRMGRNALIAFLSHLLISH
jgi:hypothetical protein